MRRLAITVLLLSGCSNEFAQNTAAPCSMNECAIENLPFAVEVTPAAPETGTLAPQRYADIDVAHVAFNQQSGMFRVVLAPAVKLYGFVSVGLGIPKTLKGSIVATRPSRIPGRPDRSYSAQINPDTGAYELRVPRNLDGESYTLRIDSSDQTTYPPQYYSVSTGSDIYSEVYFDFKLDDPADLTQLSGVVKNPLAAPLAGMRVQALDLLTRKPVSTSALTDASGRYSLRLAKKMSGTSVRLEAVPSLTAPAGTPSLAMNVEVAKTGPANTVTADIQAPAVPAPVMRSYPVAGTSPAGADMPVVGAHCLFTANVSDMASQVTATHSVLLETNLDGHATAALIPGAGGTTRKYTVTISPPAESDFEGGTVEIFAAPNDGVGAPIPLDLRPQLSGRVVDMLGRPLAGVTVQPGPSTVEKIAAATSLADLVKISSASTDRDGRFALRVDSGNYDLGIIPLTASRLPRRWLDNQAVITNTELGDLLAPPGTMARIQVVDPLGAPLKGASVELYELSAVNAMCPRSDLACLSPPRLTAEGKTASDGTLPILLPAAVEKPFGSH